MKYTAIKIWPWEVAPIGFRNLSTGEGDKEWVIFIPKELGNIPFDLDLADGEISLGWGLCNRVELDDAVIIITQPI